jgi:hypothetical protein
MRRLVLGLGLREVNEAVDSGTEEKDEDTRE